MYYSAHWYLHVMSEFGTELQSVYDDDTKDQLEGSLYTRDWTIYGTEDKAPCTHELLHGEKLCYVCQTSNTRSGMHFYMGYVWASAPLWDMDLPLSLALKQGGEVCNVEFLPATDKTLGNYYRYFNKYALTGDRGEVVMNLCRGMFKSPCVDIPNCVVAACAGKVSEDIAVISKREQLWALFVPNTAMMSIVDLMLDHDMCPIPSAHDGMSYNSSRIVVAGGVKTRIVRDGEWDTSSRRTSMSRYVKCDAVMTATFTISIVLRPYMNSKGKYSRWRYMNIVLHNIK